MSCLPDAGSPINAATVQQILDEVFPAEWKQGEDYATLAAECSQKHITKVDDFIKRVCVNRDPLRKANPGLGHCGLARAAIWPQEYPPTGQ